MVKFASFLKVGGKLHQINLLGVKFAKNKKIEIKIQLIQNKKKILF